jgi:hypothetical protein
VAACVRGCVVRGCVVRQMEAERSTLASVKQRNAACIKGTLCWAPRACMHKTRATMENPAGRACTLMSTRRCKVGRVDEQDHDHGPRVTACRWSDTDRDDTVTTPRRRGAGRRFRAKERPWVSRCRGSEGARERGSEGVEGGGRRGGGEERGVTEGGGRGTTRGESQRTSENTSPCVTAIERDEGKGVVAATTHTHRALKKLLSRGGRRLLSRGERTGERRIGQESGE